MRDSLLRVIDDLETLHDIADRSHNRFSIGYLKALEYALKELRKVIDDHADANRV